MATIIAKTIRGHRYYYLVQTAWVNGRSRYVKQRYLGKAEDIGQLFEQATAPQPTHSLNFEFGGTAALYSVAQQLQLTDIIDRHVPKRSQGLSVGQYALLAFSTAAWLPLRRPSSLIGMGEPSSIDYCPPIRHNCAASAFLTTWANSRRRPSRPSRRKSHKCWCATGASIPPPSSTTPPISSPTSTLVPRLKSPSAARTRRGASICDKSVSDYWSAGIFMFLCFTKSTPATGRTRWNSVWS